MSIPYAEQRILQIKSGNRCSFPGCPKPMIRMAAFGTREVLIGQMAHIVSETHDGPRGTHFLPPGEHNKHTNLMLLCTEHHTEIDAHEEIYTVEKLRQMKADHEALIENAITQAKVTTDRTALSYATEVVYSTLLPVVRMPRYIYCAPSRYGDGDDKEAQKEVLLSETHFLCPFVIRDGGTLFAFNDLREANGPFRKAIDHKKARGFLAETWLGDPDKSRWYMTLLNRTLNKLTGRKGLQLDKQHHRYYFKCDEQGKEKSIEYRPLNLKSTTTRKVVWQPISKRTGEPRGYWNHLAVNLRFINAGQRQWCFCIRPELRVTKDAVEPVEAKKVGSHVTRQMSHHFNYDLLEDINFWRDFLSEGRPRIVLRFGLQSMIAISTTMMAASVEWPGIPEEFMKSFSNIEYEDNLFTLAEASEIQDEESEPLPGEAGLDEDEPEPES